MALEELKKLGCSSAIISPELSEEDILALAQNPPIPLGIVSKGLWPLGVSRFLAEAVKLEEPIKSPMHEVLWVRQHGQNSWIYPGWELDLSSEHRTLDRAGFKSFVTIVEPWPRAVPRPKRTSLFNWRLKLL